MSESPLKDNTDGTRMLLSCPLCKSRLAMWRLPSLEEGLLMGGVSLITAVSCVTCRCHMQTAVPLEIAMERV